MVRSEFGVGVWGLGFVDSLRFVCAVSKCCAMTRHVATQSRVHLLYTERCVEGVGGDVAAAGE